jgi:hypothetical protein
MRFAPSQAFGEYSAAGDAMDIDWYQIFSPNVDHLPPRGKRQKKAAVLPQ